MAVVGDPLNGTITALVGDTYQFPNQTNASCVDMNGHSPTTVATITLNGYMECLEVGECLVLLAGFNSQYHMTVLAAPPPPVIDGPTDTLGYPFIKSVCKAILDKSVIIQGRFAVGTHWGGDLNNLNIDDVVNALPAKQKYPCAIMYLAVSTGEVQQTNPSRFLHREVYMAFLAGAKVTGQNAISKPGDNLQSNHTIMETWHDMERCAIGFLRTLEYSIDNVPAYANSIHISQNEIPQIQTITELGNDKVSGVAIKFTFSQTTNCGFGDYADTLQTIVLPDITDTHPLHKDM